MQSNEFQYKRRKLMSDINVVPYIDVMLVLLIIFMVTAPLLQQGIDVDLPQTRAEPLPADAQQPIVLSVNASGQYFLNIASNTDEPIAISQVRKLVKIALKNKPDIPVLVKGDRKVDYGTVVNAMSVLQQSGAPKVGLITDLKIIDN